MSQSAPEISVIVPVFNEEKNLIPLMERLSVVLKEMKVAYEILFVDDGSRDQSRKIIQKLAENDNQVRFICLSRNFGHQVALSAGIDHCKGRTAVLMDADLQDPPELIPGLFAKSQEGFEVVYARRRARKGEGWLKRFTARIFYRMLSRITSISIPLDTGDFRILDRKVIEVLRQMPEQQKFLRGQIAWAGFRQTFLEYDRDERHGGKTKFTWFRMIRFAIDGITSFSDFPLRVATIAGFIVSGMAFILILYAFYSYYFLEGNEPGWASTIVSVLFIGGIQLIGIGIIGEYIARMSSNVRNRPLYIVEDTNVKTSDNQPADEKSAEPQKQTLP
jgi:polyisoprenyl-phosphate glycosyltransferase